MIVRFVHKVKIWNGDNGDEGIGSPDQHVSLVSDIEEVNGRNAALTGFENLSGLSENGTQKALAGEAGRLRSQQGRLVGILGFNLIPIKLNFI
jgi:hypothetical protein